MASSPDPSPTPPPGSPTELTHSPLVRLGLSQRLRSPVLVPLLILLGTGLFALDFGQHWDEDNAWLKPLQRSYEVGAPLPGKYNYPSLGFWLTFIATLPEALFAKLQDLDVSTHVIGDIYEQPFRLRLRAIFLVVSSLGVLWLHQGVKRWRGSAVEALVAAGLLALSFEVSYHTRWVAPDGLLMQFAALTLMGCLGSVARPTESRWLWLAAVAAGLGCGAKYPGGLLIVPVLLAFAMAAMPQLKAGKIGRSAALLAGLLAAFALTFLATTPGAILEPELFEQGIEYEREHYSSGGHGVYTVEAGAPHLERMLVYFGSQLLSPFEPIAWALAGLAILGVIVVGRERPMVLALLISFPVLHVAYMSTMIVCAVRNVLVVAPFMALFAARGAAFLAQRERPGALRGAVIGATLAVLVGHAVHNAQAAERTRNRSLDRSLIELAQFMDEEAQARVGLSESIRTGLEARNLTASAGRSTGVHDTTATHIALLANECQRAADTWIVGPIDLETFGPREINFRYYPTAWSFDQRILLMPVSTARLVGLVD